MIKIIKTGKLNPSLAATQHVVLNNVALEKATPEMVLRPKDPVKTMPAKEIQFNHVILSIPLFNINRNGPVITKDASPFYNDRFDAGKKWYFPQFNLKDPLQNSFLFNCYINGVDANANPSYAGEASFTLQKNIPAEVTAQIQNDPSSSFNEIPLDNLSFNFNVSLVDKQVLPFPCTFVQADNSFTLTIKLDLQDGLIKFYKFISNPLNKDYCSIQINASYFGYTVNPSSQGFQNYKKMYVQNHDEAFQLKNKNMFGGGMVRKRVIRPGLTANIAGIAAANIAANAPVVKDSYTTNDALPYAKNMGNMNFDCHEFPDNFLTKAQDQTLESFRCKPPFGDGNLGQFEYIKSHFNTTDTLTGTGVNAIYLNVYNGNYLVIPEKYKIALEETDGNTLIPAAYLFTKIDANNISNSTATFKFNIAPDISGFQLLSLKKLLLKNIRVGSNKTLDDIFIEFPSKIHQKELIQFNKDQIPNTVITEMGAYAYGVDRSNFFSLEFQNVNIGNGNAALIASMLRLPEGKLIENITFDVDSDTDANPGSAIVLSLEQVTGKGLEIRQNTTDNLVYLINKTLFSISASSLADKNDDAKNLEPAVIINPNQSVSTSAIADVTEVPFTEFEYIYIAGQDYIDKMLLKEIRTDVGYQVKDDVIVTNNTGLYSIYSIDHIELIVSIVNPDNPTPALYTTNIISLATDGAVTFIDFVLPVASYLSKWSVVYSTDIHFTDNTIQQNDPQQIEDINSIGKLINLTASNLDLHKS